MESRRSWPIFEHKVSESSWFKDKQMREKIRLVSSAGTGHFYTTTKNKRLHPEKMETRKYDPRVRKHVLYKEAKIK